MLGLELLVQIHDAFQGNLKAVKKERLGEISTVQLESVQTELWFFGTIKGKLSKFF